MKALIWIESILITSMVAVIIKAAGVTLGAIPTIILYAPMFIIAPILCKKWDKHKADKNLQETNFPESAENASSYLLPFDKEADFKERLSEANAKQNSPIIAISKEGHKDMMALRRENPELFDRLSNSIDVADNDGDKDTLQSLK